MTLRLATPGEREGREGCQRDSTKKCNLKKKGNLQKATLKGNLNMALKTVIDEIQF